MNISISMEQGPGEEQTDPTLRSTGKFSEIYTCDANVDDARRAYKICKRELCKAISEVKRKNCRNLCHELDNSK